MSAGRSSHDSACFSVDLTKYLMLSKSMPDRSAPKEGMGLRPKYLRPFSLISSIHSGSFLRAEMSRTTSSDSPRRADAPAASESAQPNLYVPSPSSWSFAVVVILSEPSGLVGGLRYPFRACHVRRADPVAVRDGRQPLHRGAEQPGERFRLRLAQLRELGRDVRDRAMVLAELLAAAGPQRRGAGRRGGVTVRGQRLRERGDLVRAGRRHRRPVPALQFGHLPAGELGDRFWPRRLGEEAERAGGQVVVGVLERAAARVGDREQLGRAAAAPA